VTNAWKFGFCEKDQSLGILVGSLIEFVFSAEASSNTSCTQDIHNLFKIRACQTTTRVDSLADFQREYTKCMKYHKISIH